MHFVVLSLIKLRHTIYANRSYKIHLGKHIEFLDNICNQFLKKIHPMENALI